MRRILFFIALLVTTPVLAEDLALCKIGWINTQLGNHEKAIKLFEKCIETGRLTKSSRARTYRNIGIANYRKGEYKEAIKNYNRSLSLNPFDPLNDYVDRGNTWSELGKYENALRDYDIALNLLPNFNQAYYNRGIVYEKLGKNKMAIIEFIKACRYGLRSKKLYNRLVVYGLIKNKYK